MPKISEAQRLDRQRAVLQAAESVFGRRGFVEATIDDIAQEAGVSKGYVYTYFPTKEDVFLAVVRDFDTATSRWEALTQNLASTRGMAAEERLLSLWDTIAAQWSVENLNRVKLQLEIWSQASRNPRLQEALDTRSSRSLRFVETILEESTPEVFDETDHTGFARLWWATIDGLVLYWIGHGTTPTSDELHKLRDMVVLLTHRIFPSS